MVAWKGFTMGQPVVHSRLRSFYGSLFDWEFDTSAPVAAAISEAGNYGFVERNATSDGTGIPGGVGGGAGYAGHVLFYVGVPNVEAALQEAERLGETRRMGPVKNPGTDLSDPRSTCVRCAGVPHA